MRNRIMGTAKYFLIFMSFTTLLRKGNGCQIDGITNWLFTEEVQIFDYHEGIFWSRAATNVAEIINFSTGGGVNSGRYITAALENGNVTLTTTAEYSKYEENEISATMSFTLTFRCTDGASNLLTYAISVIDTNNHDPVFLPDNSYEFTVLPPLPPGFEITGCGQDIVVQDIDLTTSSILFTIEENPYVEVIYKGRSPTEHKQFLASIKTKDLIRRLPEGLELTISAKDVDSTGDPPRTANATIKLKADEEFQFPEEPIFSQPLYLATYDSSVHEVVLQQSISLKQGFDKEVVFSLDREQSSDSNIVYYFELDVSENQVSIITNSLPDEVFRSGQVILIIQADRQYTSGDAATVIIQFPEVPGLEFEEAQCSGQIVDNILQPLQLSLKQGYDDEFNVSIIGEYSSYFSTTTREKTITLLMSGFDASITEENSFLTLQVVASNIHSSTTALVTLEIVKDDIVTPLFEKPIYTGEYTLMSGLTLEQITLVQGYDDSVSFILQGDYAKYFSHSNEGATVTVTSSTIPVEEWAKGHIMVTLGASKPRSVTSTTTLAIGLPSARELSFGAPVYSGTVREAIVELPTLPTLSEGYDGDVNFTLHGEYSSYFGLSTSENEVALNLSTALPDDIISKNYFLTLTLQAAGIHAVPAFTTLVLEVIKEDAQTPVFTEHVYQGTYENNILQLESISLMQGYDNTVMFSLQGEFSQYFRLHNDENNVTLELETEIPAEVIFKEKVLVFTMLAEKIWTVGASAAVTISFAEELTGATLMGFSKNTYVGYLENNELNLDDIVLQSGFEESTKFILTGQYVSYFLLEHVTNVVNITLADSLSEEITAGNKFIILELKAERERAVPVTVSIVIDIKKEEIVMPVFSKPYFVTEYSNDTFEDKVISLSQGYDNTVSFALDGDNSNWFSLTQSGENVILSLNSSNGPIPADVLENNDYFLFTILAFKSGTTTAKAVVFVDIPKEIPEPTIVRFTQSSYVGHIENEEFYAPIISLTEEREPVYLVLTGDYAQYFEVAQTTPTNVEIKLKTELPEYIYTIPFIILNIEAQYPEAVSGHTTVICEIIQTRNLIIPVFEHAYYTGEFVEKDLLFDQSIQLIQGFDESVVFTLAGDDAQFFELIDTDNNTITLAVNDGLQEIKNRTHLIFTIVAHKPNSVPGMAAIIITLPEYFSWIPLRFAQNIYRGNILNGSLDINNIVLNEGYSPDLSIMFTGDYATYFQLTNQEETFTLQTISELPVEIVDNNNVLVFNIEVQLGVSKTHTTIILEIVKSEVRSLAFEEVYYVGSYYVRGGFTFNPKISLKGGYDETVSFTLEGENSQWFSISQDQYPVTLTHNSSIPEEIISNAQQLIFLVVSEKPGYMSARSTIVITIHDDTPILEFERIIYLGAIEDNVISIDTVSLSTENYDEVLFSLIGEMADYFIVSLENEIVTISILETMPESSIPENRLIVLELEASAPQHISAYASMIFQVKGKDTSLLKNLVFNATYYTGYYTDLEGFIFEERISLSEGYDPNVTFTLEGDDSQYFEAISSENSVSLKLKIAIPQPVVESNQHLILTILAESTNAVVGRATIIISLKDDSRESTLVLGFSRVSYVGSIENSVVNIDHVSLSEGYSENVTFTFHGDFSNYFELTPTESVILIALSNPIPEAEILKNRIVILELQAAAPLATSAYTTLVFEIILNDTTHEMVFSSLYYTGEYSSENSLNMPDTISLALGFDDNILFSLQGDQSEWFQIETSGNNITLTLKSLIPHEVLENNRKLVFVIFAEKSVHSASAVIVISLINDSTSTDVSFSKVLFDGNIENGVVTHETIHVNGFNRSEIQILGEYSELFVAAHTNGVVTVQSAGPVTVATTYLVLELRADLASSVLLLNVLQSEIVPEVIFDKALYQGRIENGVVLHEIIVLTGYSASSVQLDGEYSVLFTTSITDGTVTVLGTGTTAALPVTVTFVALELKADSASAVLLLEVIHNGTPTPPTVTFSSPSYSLRVDITQIGLVGRVEATADNGEDVTYSLEVDDVHLLQRIFVSDTGELHLSAPADSGAYHFEVSATTVFSGATESALVHLTVDPVTVCGDDNCALPPLQIFDRDEESPHTLISFNKEDYPSCRYSLNNRWPSDQQWLYVDEDGLHTHSIDREHASIAYMALSQIQIELTLECDNDSIINYFRTEHPVKNIARVDQLEHLGPYDYGSYKWILTDSIWQDSRKSLVNLIVNDINDNDPIFCGVEEQPVTVGWPVADLEEMIVPRYLVLVQATDADVGENAALVYWSTEDVLAVSPTTGLVHVRSKALLVNNSTLTVHATDRNGVQGRTGSLELLVKLIDTSHIAVVTVENAFLNDEQNILSILSIAVGYEVKAFRATVVSDTDSEEMNSRNKREAIISTGASVQLYIYGLIQREPVEVGQLTEDIKSVQDDIETVLITNTVSLEDYLESLEICSLSRRDISLLVSTIVLAALLFILIIVAAVWFFRKWRKQENYEKFSDANSLNSQNESVKPRPKLENASKPRMNIEELIRSERRLREMLDNPVTEIVVEPVTSKAVPEKNIEAKTILPEPPLIIQSIDKLKDVDDDSEDEDEFGERRKARRKSVVTFNENVERIIHVEDPPNDPDDLEVYRL